MLGVSSNSLLPSHTGKNAASAPHTTPKLPYFSTSTNMININVPRDGGCLFWAVTFNYLLPAIGNDDDFKKQFQALFGTEHHDISINEVKFFLLNAKANQFAALNTQTNQSATTLTKLKETFRNKVLDYIAQNRNHFEPYLENSELWNDYLNRIQNPNEYGGDIEIVAISLMLNCTFNVCGVNINNNPPPEIHLVYKNGNHYDFRINKTEIPRKSNIDIQIVRGETLKKSLLGIKIKDVEQVKEFIKRRIKEGFRWEKPGFNNDDALYTKQYKGYRVGKTSKSKPLPEDFKDYDVLVCNRTYVDESDEDSNKYIKKYYAVDDITDNLRYKFVSKELTTEEMKQLLYEGYANSTYNVKYGKIYYVDDITGNLRHKFVPEALTDEEVKQFLDENYGNGFQIKATNPLTQALQMPKLKKNDYLVVMEGKTMHLIKANDPEFKLPSAIKITNVEQAKESFKSKIKEGSRWITPGFINDTIDPVAKARQMPNFEKDDWVVMEGKTMRLIKANDPEFQVIKITDVEQVTELIKSKIKEGSRWVTPGFIGYRVGEIDKLITRGELEKKLENYDVLIYNSDYIEHTKIYYVKSSTGELGHDYTEEGFKFSTEGLKRYLDENYKNEDLIEDYKEIFPLNTAYSVAEARQMPELKKGDWIVIEGKTMHLIKTNDPESQSLEDKVIEPTSKLSIDEINTTVSQLSAISLPENFFPNSYARIAGAYIRRLERYPHLGPVFHRFFQVNEYDVKIGYRISIFLYGREVERKLYTKYREVHLNSDHLTTNDLELISKGLGITIDSTVLKTKPCIADVVPFKKVLEALTYYNPESDIPILVIFNIGGEDVQFMLSPDKSQPSQLIVSVRIGDDNKNGLFKFQGNAYRWWMNNHNGVPPVSAQQADWILNNPLSKTTKPISSKMMEFLACTQIAESHFTPGKLALSRVPGFGKLARAMIKRYAKLEKLVFNRFFKVDTYDSSSYQTKHPEIKSISVSLDNGEKTQYDRFQQVTLRSDPITEDGLKLIRDGFGEETIKPEILKGIIPPNIANVIPFEKVLKALAYYNPESGIPMLVSFKIGTTNTYFILSLDNKHPYQLFVSVFVCKDEDSNWEFQGHTYEWWEKNNPDNAEEAGLILKRPLSETTSIESKMLAFLACTKIIESLTTLKPSFDAENATSFPMAYGGGTENGRNAVNSLRRDGGHKYRKYNNTHAYDMSDDSDGES